MKVFTQGKGHVLTEYLREMDWSKGIYFSKISIEFILVWY